MIADPMRIVAVDWNNGNLSIELNHEANSNWIWALKHMGGYSSVMGKGPEYFVFNGKIARIDANSSASQQIIDYFKEWLPLTNRMYENKLKQELLTAEQRQRDELQSRIKREEERANVIRNLRF